jgi:cysteine-rich repeat protein
MEACDDGNTTANDGCGVTCTLEAGFDCAGTAPTVCATRCGDGLVRGAETCDDGNTRPGDGCGSSCTVESEFEAEPNETNGTANPLSWMPARVLGTLESSNDVDVYRFTLTRLTDLRIVTDDGSGPESCLNVDTYVRLMDERGDALAADDDSGLSFCSLLDPSRVPEVTRLRPGTYYVSVSPVLFRGTSPLPYGLSIHVAATCGDGDRTSTEVCDDGNTADGDSCNRFCQLPPTMEVEPNDTPGTASGPLVPGSISGGALSTASDVDLYRFTLTAITDVAVEVFDESGPESCKGGIDPNVAVLDAQGATVAYDDDDGTAWCPRLGAAWGDRALRRLRPGTWYVRVGASSFTAIPDYTVRLRYEAVCGDGSVSGSEECDGGNSCTSTCERIPVCGDGQLDSPEQCDDGNTTDGDSCSRTCRVEGIPSAEVEPNGNLSEADVRSVGAPPVRITGSTQLSGSFSSPQDLDVFRVEVAAPTVVRFETFHGGLQRCAYTGATRIRLFPASGSVTATSSNDGIEQCSALLLHLAAGVHYVEVSAEAGVDTPFAYILEVSFLASSGAETEPNESLDTATPLSITNGEGFVTATHRSEPDVDFYRLTVPTGGRSLRAEITEGSATERCESLGIDTLLTLRDANGTELVVNDDGGRGYCSRLDGRGSTPDDFGARNLAAGTYYLEVRSQPPSGDGAIFDYRLSVMLR